MDSRRIRPIPSSATDDIAAAVRIVDLASLAKAFERWPRRDIGAQILDWVADPRVQPG